MSRLPVTALILACATAMPACYASARDASPRAVTLLDAGWRFYPLQNFALWSAEPELTSKQIQELKPPAPGEQGWRSVHLPDDYIVRGTFSPDPNPSLLAGGAVCTLGGRECDLPGSEPNAGGHVGALNRPGRTNYGGHGYLPVYPAWYERDLIVPDSDRGKTLWLDFGGVYRDAIVFINGKFIAQHASGYTAFRLNITSAVESGKQNTIAVFVDPRWFEGWW